MPHTLLQAKLHTPRPEHPLVVRAGLIQRIEAGAAGAATLIIAPAGYGKTTLAAQWAEQTEKPVAWLSLDAGDNDLAQFLTAVIAAVQTLHPSACSFLRGTLERSPLPDSERLALLLSSEIDLLPARFVLVLDDAHQTTDHAVQRLLGELLNYAPSRMHLLLIARRQPALALGRLRASRNLTEIGAQDLRFTEQETETLLAQKWRAPNAGESAAALCASTEGWVAGLHLMTLSLGPADSLPARMLQERGASQYVAEYLLEQVLLQQPPLVREFLLKSSILERLTPPLTEAVTGISRREAGVSLPELARAGLFMTAMDKRDEWYVYHPLFRDLLQQQLAATLPPAEIAVLHRRASAWLSRFGHADEALRHAFAGGEQQLAVQIVVEHAIEWLEEDRWRTIERRLSLFPAAIVEQHPWLLMVKGHALQLQFKWDALLPLLNRAEQQLAGGAYELTGQQMQLLRSYLDVLWALHWSAATDAPKSTAAARRALQMLPEKSHYARGVLQLALTLSLQSSGEAVSAEQMLAAALTQAELSADSGVAVMRPLLCLLSLSFAEGDIRSAAQMARILLHKATATGSLFNELLAHLALGAAAYEMNDLPSAAEHFEQGARLRHASHARGGHECLVGLALTYHAQGRHEAAKAALIRLNELHVDLASSALAAEGATLQLRLGMGGAPSEMRAALRRCVPIRTGIWYGWLEIPALTEVRLALAAPPAQNQVQNLAQLEAAVNELWAAALQLHKPGSQAAVLALMALLLHRRNQGAAAIETLRRCLELGEKHGLVRSIADTGPALEPLLAEVAALQPSAYQEQVRAAIIKPDARLQGSENRRTAPKLAAPLTRREREVLSLLGQYRTDREIAETLVISPLTVRTHIENLASKLAANGRRAIVNRAREHGLLA